MKAKWRKIIFLAAVCFTCGCGFSEGFYKGKEAAYYWGVLRDLKSWAIAFDNYHKSQNQYPEGNNVNELKLLLDEYSKGPLPLIDPWEGTYIVESKTKEYLVSFTGKNHSQSHGFNGALDNGGYEVSATIQNGHYKQYLKKSYKSVDDFEQEIEQSKLQPFNKSDCN